MTKNIVITGAGGQIGYCLLLSIAQGYLLKSKCNLHMLETEEGQAAALGVKMELEDTASPYIKDIFIHTDPKKAFEKGDIFFFLGAFPRGPGMERRDLLEKNAQIFIKQAEGLKKANPLAKILVVGNPCNTNAWILKKKCGRDDILITSMSTLDELRAKSFIARRLNLPIEHIENVIIWGNHSKSLFVDTHYATISKNSLQELVEKNALEKSLQEFTQKRGAEVIQVRGKSSAASAANAAIKAMKQLIEPSCGLFSMGVYTKNNPFGIDEDLFFSLPCFLDKDQSLKVAGHLKIEHYKQFLEPSLDELIEERDTVLKLIQ